MRHLNQKLLLFSSIRILPPPCYD